MEENTENSNSGGFGEIKEREFDEDGEETTQGEQIENDSEDSQEDNSEQTDNQEGEEGNEENKDDKSQESQQTTEKGTKLDKNPKSAVHQQLANEKKIRGQYEQVLASPRLMQRYLREQFGIDVNLDKSDTGKTATENQDKTTTPVSTTKKWTAKDFESLEDVADKFNGLQEQFQSEISKRDGEIEGLKKQLGGMSERDSLVQIADTMESDVKALRENPELDPNSPDYIEGLEEKIGGMFRGLDFDRETGSYRGQHSIRQIGETMIAAARIARKSGVQRGQTIVKDKTKGQVRTTSTADGQVDTSKVSPGQSIAQGVAKMFK